MPTEKLDYIFPFAVFFYGLLMVFVGELAWTQRLKKMQLTATQRAFFETLLQTVGAHRPLALICFWGGGLWSLQNLIFTP